MSARRRAWRFGLVGALLAAGACRNGSEAPRARVEFGVPFGGDVQDRSTIELGKERELALRVTFPEPLARETVVSWELERPSKQRNPDGGVAYAAEIGERRVRAGERRVDASLGFRRGDPPGTWRIHVRIDGRPALDRQFQVIEPPK